MASYQAERFSDPNLPSYESEDYREQLPRWEFVADMFEGRSAWYSVSQSFGNSSTGGITDFLKAVRYLPQEEAEPGIEYVKRISRSYFDRKFADAITSSAAFLSRFTVNPDTLPNILDNLDNVDLCGNSLEVFLKSADIKALKDDHCFILVEFPKPPTDESGNSLITDAYTESQYQLHPYLVLIDARDVINWDVGYAAGKIKINQVTIRECVSERDGRFGAKKKTRYRVLSPGSYEVYELNKENDREDVLILVDSGNTSLKYVPIVPYTVTPNDTNPFIGKPPLYDIAEMNLKLYQKESEKDESMHKCNFPTLLVKEITPARPHKANEDPPVIRVGPNSCFWNLEASYIEPSGSALGQTQADIEKLELAIQTKTLSFQSGYFAPPTATEIMRDTSTAQASLGGMARSKESAVQQVFEFWADYMRSPGKGGSIAVFKKIVDTPLESSKAAFLLQVRIAGEISRELFLKILREGEILPKDLDIESEIAIAEGEAKAKVVEQQQMAQEALMQQQKNNADSANSF